MVQKIRAVLIIEVAGRPPEFLSESLTAHIDKIKLVKGVSLVNSTFASPKKLDEEKDLYTTFAEVEVLVDSLSKLFDLIFEFMPSSIEILDPTEIEFNSQETTMLLNDLAGRLHKYDDLAKIAKFRIHELMQQLQKPNNIAPTRESIIQPLKVTLEDKKEAKATEPKKTKTKQKKK